MKSIKSLVILGVLMVAAVPAFAQSTATATVAVSASVVPTCEWAGDGALAFGAYDPFLASPAGDKTATTTLSFRCTKTRSGVTVAFDVSAYGSMANTTTAGDTLTYSVQHFERTAALADFTTSIGTSAWQDMTLNGTLLGGQSVSDGDYAETITIDINY
jgi:spore coat protein U-like protein